MLFAAIMKMFGRPMMPVTNPVGRLNSQPMNTTLIDMIGSSSGSQDLGSHSTIKYGQHSTLIVKWTADNANTRRICCDAVTGVRGD